MNDITSLTEGVRYDASKLRLAGWIDPDGPRYDTPHLDHHAYLDDDGTYLGPDDEGIEPVFERASMIRLDPDPVAEIEAVLNGGEYFFEAAGLNTSDVAQEWHELGFSAPEVREWWLVGIRWPIHADALRLAKITPHQIALADDILAKETGHYVSLDALSDGEISIERLIEVASNLPAE